MVPSFCAYFCPRILVVVDGRTVKCTRPAFIIMIVQYDPKKLQEKLHGPYPIVEIRTNGTISLQRRPGISKSYNIRKLRSYKGPNEAARLQAINQRQQDRHY